MVLNIELTLPSPPAGWAGEKDFKVIDSLSSSVLRTIEPVGPHFLAYARRKKHKRTFSEDDRIQAAKAVTKVEATEEDSDIDDTEDPELLQRDPKDWKNQDHYAILGLSKLRWQASEEKLKKAHRRKVLKHHPDKKAAFGDAHDDNFFKCIQKATEVLMDPIKRRQFDSIDEGADVPPPTKKEIQAGDYYQLWSNFFKSEGRFSNIKNVPEFGNANSSREQVEGFYNFFYNFDSWRSFEYLDQDVPDDNENRDQKRQVERKNQNARKKKKTEDTARLRRIVDEVLASDERMKKFRKEGKKKSKKQIEREEEQARLNAEKEAAEAKKREAEAEEARKQASLLEEKASSKKAKEAAKNAAKKAKRTLRSTPAEFNNFGGAESAVSGDLDVLVAVSSAEQVVAFASKISAAKGEGESALKAVYDEIVAELVGAGSLKKESLGFF